MKKILYIDMDNVLVDFPSGISKLSQEVIDESKRTHWLSPSRVRVRFNSFKWKGFGGRARFSVHRYGIKKFINRKRELGGIFWHELHQSIYNCPKNKTHSYEFHNLIRVHDPS